MTAHAELVEVRAEGCIASFHLHRGQRALLALSNVGGRRDAVAAVTLALLDLGLRGEVRDAYTAEPVPGRAGEIRVPLPVHSMRLLWIE